jgi:putative ABC transport system substrate-binding protein
MGNVTRRQMVVTALATSSSMVLAGRRLNAADLPKIGLIHPGPKGPIPSMKAVVTGLADLGHIDGETITLEFRYGENKPDLLPSLSASLVEQGVKVIVAVTGDALIQASKATKTIPIVSAAGSGDFVTMGLIKNWDHPGTNVTGMNLDAGPAAAARVNILKLALPAIGSIAVLANSAYPGNDGLLAAMRMAAAQGRINLDVREVGKADDLEAAIPDAKKNGAHALASVQGPLFFFQRKLLADLALQHDLPLAMSEYGAAEAGAFLQVNPDIGGCARQSARFVDAILKGANAGDMKIERHGGYDVVFNRTTAAKFGANVSSDLVKEATFVG